MDELAPTRMSLIGRLRNWDDQESWREFFDLYWKLIYGAGLKAGLTPAEAQDAVQDTIVSVCKSINKFKADPARGSFKSWLMQITRWRVLDQLRKRPREEVARYHRKPPETGSDPGSTLAGVPDPANALEQIWENEWERNLLTAALEKLERQVSAKHYQVFYLHVIKQKTVEQVARVAGIKQEQVYVIKGRLSGLFKQAVEESEQRMCNEA